MNAHRFLFLVFAVALTASGSLAQESLTFQAQSKVWVEGTSTVHDWECEAEQLAGTLSAKTASPTLASLSATTLVIPVQTIECGNGTMNGKLRDAFDVRENPTIRYALTSAEVGDAGADGWFSLATRGRLTMAGTTRTVQIPVKAKALGNGRYRFVGEVPLQMTDYGIDPPTAMLGTLKTGNDVVVHFDVTAGS